MLEEGGKGTEPRAITFRVSQRTSCQGDQREFTEHGTQVPRGGFPETHSVGSNEDKKQQGHWDVDKSSSNEVVKMVKLMVKTERQEWKMNQAGLQVRVSVLSATKGAET